MKKEDFFLDFPFELCRSKQRGDQQGASGTAGFQQPQEQNLINFGEDKSGNRFSALFKFRIDNLSPGVKISKASIVLIATSSNSGGSVDVACLEPDGKWDRRFRNNERTSSVNKLTRTINTGMKLGGSSSGDLGGMRISAVAGSDLAGENDEDQITADYNLSLNYAYSDVRDGTISTIQSVGQLIKIDTTQNTIDRIRIRATRTSTAASIPGTGIKTRIWTLNPSTFEPTGTQKTLTNQVNYTSMGVGYTSYSNIMTTQTFTSGDAYACEIETDGTRYDKDHYVSIALINDSGTAGLDDDELIYIRGPIGAFSPGGYPSRSDVPFLYTGNSGTTIDTPPHNSIITSTLPSNSAAGDEVRIDVTQILQEWVNSAQYRNLKFKSVGFTVSSADHFGTSSEQNYDEDDTNMRLEVEYSPVGINIT